MRPPLPHWAPALGDADLHGCPLSPLEQFEALPLVAPPALNRGGLTEPETEANRSCQQQWLLSFALHQAESFQVFIPLFRGKLSLVPVNGYPLAVAKQGLQLALPFLFAKNLLEPIKQISTAREAVPFLFVIIVVFNLGSHPEVCGMGEPLASAS